MTEQNTNIAASAGKIIRAATDLFARESFSRVSIKEIAAASGVNSALISYYFGGKKNLYQEILNTQADAFLKLQEKITETGLPPLEKLRLYADSIAAMQDEHPYHIHLIYRELLSPQPMFENYVKKRLYRIHQFMADLVAEAVGDGDIVTAIRPTHVAFTLESIIMFFFLMRSHVRTLGRFAPGTEKEYLIEALDTYLSSLKPRA